MALTAAVNAVLLRLGVFVLLAILGYVFIPSLLYPLAGLLVAASLGSFAAAAIANAVTLRIYERAQLADIGLGWTRASRRNLAIGLLGGIAGALFVLLIPVTVRIADVTTDPKAHLNWPAFLFVTVILIFGAIGEEMLFRGYAFQILIRAVGPFATILPVALLFALAHANNQNVTFFGLFNTFLWGVLLGYSFLRSGDLWLPIGLHFGWNWTLPLLGVNLSGFTIGMTGLTMHWRAGDLWSGGAYGPEGGILTTVVVILLYFYLEKMPVEPQEPWLLYKGRS